MIDDYATPLRRSVRSFSPFFFFFCEHCREIYISIKRSRGAPREWRPRDSDGSFYNSRLQEYSIKISHRNSETCISFYFCNPLRNRRYKAYIKLPNEMRLPAHFIIIRISLMWMSFFLETCRGFRRHVERRSSLTRVTDPLSRKETRRCWIHKRRGILNILISDIKYEV